MPVRLFAFLGKLKDKILLSFINQASYDEDVWRSGDIAATFLAWVLDGGE
jgi:hypothetical protein